MGTDRLKSYNIHQILAVIKEHPILYHPNFKLGKKESDQIWDEVAAKVNMKGVILRKKWRNLRDSYAKYLKSSYTKNPFVRNYKNWQHASEMEYFKPYLSFAKKLEEEIQNHNGALGENRDQENQNIGEIGENLELMPIIKIDISDTEFIDENSYEDYENPLGLQENDENSTDLTEMCNLQNYQLNIRSIDASFEKDNPPSTSQKRTSKIEKLTVKKMKFDDRIIESEIVPSSKLIERPNFETLESEKQKTDFETNDSQNNRPIETNESENFSKKIESVELGSTELLLLGYAKLINNFSLKRQAITKMKIAQLIMEQEIEHIEEVQRNN